MDSSGVKKRFEEGLAAHRDGLHDEARQAYDDVLRAAPEYIPALQHMGLVKQQLGDPEEGVEYLRRALELSPRDVGCWNNLANLLRTLGRNDEAIEAYRSALREDPTHVNALFNLGVALREAGELRESSRALRRLLELTPDDVQAWNELGTASYELKEWDESEKAFRRALELNPRQAAAYNNLGSILRSRGRLEDARQLFLRALEIDPNLVEAQNNLGNLLLAGGEITAAIDRYRRATVLNPRHAVACNNLGNALLIAGDITGAVPHLRRALEIDPEFHSAHSNLVFCLNYVSDLTPDELAEEHFAWGRAHGQKRYDSRRVHSNSAVPDRVLRVGYVSPDFRAHSVAYFVEPLVRFHDRNVVQCFCYSDVREEDDVTERFKARADAWRDTANLSDEDLAAAIEDDRIDILVDLSGHTRNSRLSMFALKPAPVQVTYIGYPHTTGLNAIDYRITDDLADPPGASESRHIEKLVRLAGGFLCYSPPDWAPEVSANPFRDNGYVTFGSFNNLSKMTSDVVEIWSRILLAVPGSRLLLKTQQLRDRAICERFAKMFESFGVERERVTMLPTCASLPDHLSTYSKVDIALDTFPYNGTTTTCEALWMGVPVVVLSGHSHAGRVGVSLLSRLGLRELIGEDSADYVARAIDLADDRERIERFRTDLRDIMKSSRLLDPRRICTELERAYREMWSSWCEETRAS